MAVSATEAASIYESLLEILREQELDWIVADVEERVSLGRLRTERLDVLEIPEPADEITSDLFQPGTRKRRRSKATFVVSRPFTDQERLSILIDSIHVGVVELTAIADEVAQFTANEMRGALAVFEPEAEVERSFRISRDQTVFARENTSRLASLLKELQREVPDAD